MVERERERERERKHEDSIIYSFDFQAVVIKQREMLHLLQHNEK